MRKALMIVLGLTSPCILAGSSALADNCQAIRQMCLDNPPASAKITGHITGYCNSAYKTCQANVKSNSQGGKPPTTGGGLGPEIPARKSVRPN